MASVRSTTPAVSARLARDAEELARISTIRQQVFVVEQGVATNVNGDPQDRGSFQVVGLVDGQIVGTGRLAITNRDGQIAWVAVLPDYRGLGVGRAIMLELLSQAEIAGTRVLLLNAQTHALNFYHRLGFRPIGETFIMGGIEHQLMSRVSTLG